MQFVHSREHLSEGDIVVVECTHQCNVRLTDDSNFSKFKSGAAHRHYGVVSTKCYRHGLSYHTQVTGTSQLI